MRNTITSFLASNLRRGRGSLAIARPHQPAKLLELYDMEGCPFCRPVREYLTELDLDVLIHPCPKKSTHNREELEALGGKQQMPYLYDPNTDIGLYEMKDIIAYLNSQYDTHQARRKPTANIATSTFASFTRAMAGILHRPSVSPDAPLELFSYEADPESRAVRERLTEMEINYVLRNSGKQQARIKDKTTPKETRITKYHEMMQRTGKAQLPYLYDPNTKTGTFNPPDIIQYLINTYSPLKKSKASKENQKPALQHVYDEALKH
ncbi:MAG: hypothetical protein COB04_05210 [Gammaproteobacteria bacterium]|nr:MAG: hypothetical protein COB04_05210 [Gammaproteobacteria bacterium]